MAFFSALLPLNANPSSLTFKSYAMSSSSTHPNQDSVPDFPGNFTEENPIKIAFTKSNATNKSINSQTRTGIPVIIDQKIQAEVCYDSNSADDDPGDGNEEFPLAVKLALEKAKQYMKNKDDVSSKASSSEEVQNSVAKNEPLRSDQLQDGSESKDIPSAVKVALEKAKEYQKNKGVVRSNDSSGTSDSGLKGGAVQNPDVKVKKSGKEELTISSIDFIGLGFSDKKSGRSVPAGLVPISDPFPEGKLPEVEILVGDMSNFDDAVAKSKPASALEDDADVYKPKVSTWGVFPRPSNISKAYGGGRTIRPGEELETEESRAGREARTRQLLAAYKRKTGQNIDPNLKVVCEKALNDGDSLMDSGKLKEALSFYEEIMEKLPFQTELHGTAALQWSICQDSLSKPDEARMMYEKLQSHPSPPVSKKARQFMFGFQAMEMMKVKSSKVSALSTGYQDYFKAFLKEDSNYQSPKTEVDEASFSSQALPYIIFLLSPVLIVSLLAAYKF